MKVILSQWITIKENFVEVKKMEEFVYNLTSILKKEKIKFFYTCLFENYIFVARIRIENNVLNIKMISEVYSDVSESSLIFDYKPEIKRYGGESNLPIIENIFCESSYITSSLLFHKDIEERILVVIDLTQILFNSLEIKREDIKELFVFIYEIWVNYSYHILNMRVDNVQGIVDSLRERIDRYKRNEQKSIYIEYERSVNLLKNLTYFDRGQENPEYSALLKSFIIDRGINKPFINVIISLAHMNFNRLVLFPHIESIVYKLLSDKIDSI